MYSRWKTPLSTFGLSLVILYSLAACHCRAVIVCGQNLWAVTNWGLWSDDVQSPQEFHRVSLDRARAYGYSPFTGRFYHF